MRCLKVGVSEQTGEKGWEGRTEMEATYIVQYPLWPQLMKKEWRIWAPNLHRAAQRVGGAEATYWPK